MTPTSPHTHTSAHIERERTERQGETEREMHTLDSRQTVFLNMKGKRKLLNQT